MLEASYRLLRSNPGNEEESATWRPHYYGNARYLKVDNGALTSQRISERGGQLESVSQRFTVRYLFTSTS